MVDLRKLAVRPADFLAGGVRREVEQRVEFPPVLRLRSRRHPALVVRRLLTARSAAAAGVVFLAGRGLCGIPFLFFLVCILCRELVCNDVLQLLQQASKALPMLAFGLWEFVCVVSLSRRNRRLQQNTGRLAIIRRIETD